MKTRKINRALSLILALTLLFAALPVKASAALADYDPVAMSIINRIMQSNNLSFNIDNPDPWINRGFATWDDSTPKQLIELDLSYMYFTGSLTLTGLTSLQSLKCYNNRLTDLDVTDCTALQYLDCSLNQLNSVDVTGCTSLQYLNCRSNQLSKLDTCDNTALEYLDCSSNYLTSLNVNNNTNLQELWVNSNELTSLDVSKNIALETLDCGFNQLTSLDVSKNIALSNLSCGFNQLTILDVSKNIALEMFSCSGNPLTSLDVSKNTALEILNFTNNQLTSLDVSNNTALNKLYCNDGQLTSIIVNTTLETLYCGGNQLSSLNMTDCTTLKTLSCSYNQLTGIDLTSCTALSFLDCHENQLTSLDLSNNSALGRLFCSSNQLSSLDLSNNSALFYLECNFNKLRSLDVTGLNILNYLDCRYNKMISKSDVVGYSSRITPTFAFIPQNAITDRFVDLKDDAWYLDAIDFIVDCGLFMGVSDIKFNPDGNMNRAMFVQVLMRLSDKMGIDTSGDFSNTFKDVKSDAWYKEAVSWAAAKGVVTGYDEYTFGPEDSITREQMAVMLIRFVDYAGITLKTTGGAQFSDAGKISSWAKDAVQKAAAGGLVSGIGGGFYDPLNTATRAQVAKLFGNLVQNYL